MHIKKKRLQDIDTIIHRSGAGGLSRNHLPSKAGQRFWYGATWNVPGAWCHSFYLNGHRFLAGVHLILAY